MTRFFRILSWTAGILVALVVVGIATVYFYVSSDDFRTRLEGHASALAGRKTTIADISIDWGWTPHVHLSGVEFANAKWAPPMSPPALGGVEAGLDALAGQGALELRQRAEHLEQELALRAGGVDLLGEGTERNLAFLQPVHRRQQMGQRAAQAVELPDDQAIARPQERQRFRQSRPVVTAAAGVILEQVAFIDPGARRASRWRSVVWRSRSDETRM